METLITSSACMLATILCLSYVLNVLNIPTRYESFINAITWDRKYVIINGMSFTVYDCSINLSDLNKLPLATYYKYNHTLIRHENRLFIKLTPKIHIIIKKVRNSYEVSLDILTPAPLFNNSYIQFSTDHLFILFQDHILLNIKDNYILVMIRYSGEPIWIS